MTAQHAAAAGQARGTQRRRVARARHRAARTSTTTWASSSTWAAREAAANPLHVPLSGLPAKAVTRGYHLAGDAGQPVRIAADWLLDAVLPRQTVQLGLVRGDEVPLETATPEHPHRA